MNTFEDYISFWTICKVLINKRVQLSEKRHKKHQLHLLSPEICIGELKNSEKLLLAMMPPRNSWVNLSKSTRYRDIDGEHRQRMAAAKCNKQSLLWTIKRDLNSASGNKPPYLVRLEEFVAIIKKRVGSESFEFSEPLLFPEIKDETSCRPLCKFENLEDAVILILANKYLTELFNDLFYEESLAFRSKRLYHGENNYVTAHHDAIARIKEYREKWNGKRLYVSECDLQKFYDTVSHSVVRKCYYGLLKNVSRKSPKLTFNKINLVFEAYLKCYSFPRNVYRKNTDSVFWEENKIDINKRCFKWVNPKSLTKSGRGLMNLKVGVPQGGALSGLIANMVLNSVDWKVKKHMLESDLYLRYCDDMIIMSTNKARCGRLFMTYFDGAKELKLVPHEPEKDLKFRHKDFWKGKSKKCYLWEMKQLDAAEWIGFVGYEMRRDGMLRIRKKSFRKELDKQTSVVFEKTLKKINGKERVSDKSILGTLEKKLISMSVGKVSVWNAPFIESEMCWSAGFKELEMNPVLKKQLRELDRHRGVMLAAAKRYLKADKSSTKEVIRGDVEQLDKEKNPDKVGMVHSYYYQFAREKH